MRRKLIIACALFLSAMSCKDDSVRPCVTGTIIGYEQCSNAVLIKVDDQHPIGKTVQFYDKVSYENVVRAPGDPAQYGSSTIYFQYRPFDQEKDAELFEYSAVPCLAIYAPFDVPTIVVTNISTDACDGTRE